MNIERIVQIHIAALTVIGATLLGMGQHDSLLPLLVMFAAVTSVVFTDILNWFRLNRFMANLAALFALFFSLDDFFQADSRSQLLAIANLLTYLQIVLFYQRKSDRIYWQLAVLSLLQVMVSAALNVGLEFGVVLILYTSVAISTLGFFFLHRELSLVAGRGDRELGRRTRHKHQDRVKREEAPWSQLLDRTPVATPVAVAQRITRQLIGWRFLQQLIVIGVTTMVFTVVLFFSAPRLDNASRQSLQSRTSHIVGFSPEISLNELHEVLQNETPVMRVTLRDATTGEPYRVFNDPYFRGSVLIEYDFTTGIPRWRQRGSGRPLAMIYPKSCGTKRIGPLQRARESSRRSDNWNLPEPPNGVPLVRQDMMLAPLDDAVLFGAYPVYQLPYVDLRDIRINPRTRQMYSRHRARGYTRSEYRYSIATTAFHAGLQVNVTPHDNRLENFLDPLLLELEKVELLRLDPKRYPRLKEIADEIRPPRSVLRPIAPIWHGALERHLRDTELYDYTLRFDTIQRDPDLDPIEHFVANHRSGHCEYFASALVMMLRSQGIPARMVVGFKGGEYNTLGGYYQVRQSDAHAWVEAYLEPKDVTGQIPAECDTSPGGGWLRSDPTPEDVQDDSEKLERGLLHTMGDMLDYARLLWTDYILGLTASRQRESIYGPVTDSADPEAWSALFDQLQAGREPALKRIRLFVFSKRGVMAALGLILTFILFRLQARRHPDPQARRAARRWFPRNGMPLANRQPDTRRLSVAFYERLETLLRPVGVARSRGQTPREFAAEAQTQLSASEYSHEAVTLPRRIVDFFYRVRFGESPLDEPEIEVVERELDALEQETHSQQTQKE